MVLALLFKIGSLPPVIPLFYSRSPGEFQLADWWLILLLPILMNGLFVVNTILSRKFFSEDEFIPIFLYYFKFFIIISFTLIYLKIIFLIS